MDVEPDRTRIDGLDQLGLQLARVAEADAHRGRGSWLRRPGLVIAVLAVLLIPTGGYAIAEVASDDGIITPSEAIDRLTMEQLEQLRLQNGNGQALSQLGQLQEEIQRQTAGSEGRQPIPGATVGNIPARPASPPLSERPRVLGQVKCSAVDRASDAFGDVPAVGKLKAQCVLLHRANRK